MEKIKLRIKSRKEDKQVTLRAGDCISLYNKGESKPAISLTFQKGEYIYLKINPKGRDSWLTKQINRFKQLFTIKPEDEYHKDRLMF